jgi:hypothetical protein
MWRIDRFYSADDPDAVSVFRSFYPRFASMSRIVFAYLKKHPAILDSSLIEKIEGKPQYDWCMNLYRTKVTRIGAEIVEEDESGFEGNRLVKGSRDGISVPNAERLYMDSMIRAADLYNQLLKSIKPSEFRSMDIKDKISALAKLADVNKGMRNFKPNATVFNQLNVYGAQRDDLEKAILDFNKIG